MSSKQMELTNQLLSDSSRTLQKKCRCSSDFAEEGRDEDDGGPRRRNAVPQRIYIMMSSGYLSYLYCWTHSRSTHVSTQNFSQIRVTVICTCIHHLPEVSRFQREKTEATNIALRHTEEKYTQRNIIYIFLMHNVTYV